MRRSPGEAHLLFDDVGLPTIERDLPQPPACCRRDVMERPPLRLPVRRPAVKDDSIAGVSSDEPMHLIERRADRGHVPRAICRTIEADRGLVVARPPARWIPLLERRRDDHVLDRPALERPEKVPLTTHRALGAIGQPLVRDDVPAADELPEEHELVAMLRVRTRSANDLFDAAGA